MTGAGGSTTLDEVLEALAHPTRRQVIYTLRDREVATVDEVAKAVLDEGADAPPDEGSSCRRDRVKTELIHTHLPNLAESNFVEYDRRSETVRYSDPPELLERVVRFLAGFERRG